MKTKLAQPLGRQEASSMTAFTRPQREGLSDKDLKILRLEFATKSKDVVIDHMRSKIGTCISKQDDPDGNGS